MNPINPMNDYRPVRRFNPIGVLLDTCLIIENMPEHVQYALTTPPEGHCACLPNKHRHPDGSALFYSVIPRDTADARSFIQHARFPHKPRHRATDLLKEHFGVGDQGMLLFFLTCVNAFSIFELGTDHLVSITSFAALSIIGAIFVVTMIGVLIKEVRNQKHPVKDLAATPTREMQRILNRSIPITRTVDVAHQAWQVYCYDHDNYNEFADLCSYISTIKAPVHSDTYATQKQILATWIRTSKLRQETNKKKLRERIHAADQVRQDAAQREREIESTADQFQAKFLRETVLEPMQAYEKSTKMRFDALREAEQAAENTINVENDPYYYQ